MRFPRRALVALGTIVAAIGGTLGIAVPAAHAATLTTQTLSVSGVGSVTVTVTTDLNNNVYEEVAVTNNQHDGTHCVEGWADLYLWQHRPANGFPNCVAGTYDSGALAVHWPRSGSLAGQAIIINDLTDTAHVKMALCDLQVGPSVNGTRFERDNTACTESPAPNGSVGAISGGSYNLMPWQSEQNIACSGCSTDMRPEYTNRGHIDLGDNVGNQVLQTGDMLVSFDGSHRAVEGNGGSYNVVNNTSGSSGSTTWATAWCLTAGHSLAPGDNMRFQSDGNEVASTSSNVPEWASANMTGGYPSPCRSFAGSFISGGSPYTIMQSDGNLVEYSSPAPGPSVLWASNTAGL